MRNAVKFVLIVALLLVTVLGVTIKFYDQAKECVFCFKMIENSESGKIYILIKLGQQTTTFVLHPVILYYIRSKLLTELVKSLLSATA